MATHWPMLLDIDKDNCKRLLRCLELEAYASLVSAFRAQGDLTKEKKKVLQELCNILGISTERHRAEVRRVVNDERLATIADVVAGSSDYSEWSIEGRRLVPLMPRLVPQTAFTNIANANAAIAAQQNACLPPPSATKNVKVTTSNSFNVVRSSPITKTVSSEEEEMQIPAVQQMASDSTSDHDPFLAQHEIVVSTSPGEEEEDKSLSSLEFPLVNIEETSENNKPPQKKRLRALSNDSGGTISQILFKGNSAPFTSFNLPSASVSTPDSSQASTSAAPLPTRTVDLPVCSAPLQFTIAGTGISTAVSKLPANVTSALNSMYPSQKVFLVSTSGANLPSSILQRSLTVPIVKTVTGTNSSVTVSSQSTSRPTPSPLITPISSSTPVSLVLSTANAESSTITTSQSAAKNLKIIAQGIPVSATTRLGQIGQKLSIGNSMPPIVVVTKTSVGKGTTPTTRLVNVIGAQSSSVKTVPSLVALGPKGKQAAFLKVPPGMSLATATDKSGKPNVYVVQKSQMLQKLKQAQPVGAFAISTSSFSSGAQTVLKSGAHLTKAHYKEGFRLPAVVIPKPRASSVPSLATTVVSPASTTMTATSSTDKEISAQRKSSVLADLLQAAGILPDGSVNPNLSLDEVANAISSTEQQSNVNVINVDEQRKDSANIAISNFVEQLKARETVTAFNQSCFAHPAELAKGQQTSAKQKPKLTRSETGGYDPKIGRFSPYPTTLSSNRNVEVTSATPAAPQPPKSVASLSLEALIQSSLGDIKTMQSPLSITEGSALRRELMIGKNPETKCSPPSIDDTVGVVPPEGAQSFPQAMKSYLYKGVTYSKEDRKKVNDSLTVESMEIELSTSPTTAVTESSVDQTSIMNVVESRETMDMIENDIQFTDDTLTAVVEETVITTEDSTPTEVEIQVCSQPEESSNATAASVNTNVISLDMPSFVTDDPAPIRFVATSRSNTQSSGSSVFMVSDSVEPTSQSPYIIEQGLCAIEGLEGGSETLEIIGSTEDLDSVESRVAALHGEEEVTEFDKSFSSTNNATKKKKVSALAESISTGWYRSAIGLLHRVMKFRGPNRFKAEPGASQWFLYPVSATDVPDYHKIVTKPMDFTTIMKKLEKFAYKNLNEFHADMLLVKHNCELYNPEEHQARIDCEHVFTFYQQEFNKLLTKMQPTSSPQKKRKT